MNPTPFTRRSNRVTFALVGGWIALVAAGVHQLNRHMVTASTLPAESDVERISAARLAAGGPLRLVMLVHPRCPCTQAGLRALQAILEDSRKFVPVDLLIFRPRRRTEASWSVRDFQRRHGDLERSGIRFLDDPDGLEATRLGLKASGHLLVVDPEGHVRFSGGLTAGRGQAVPGDGADAVRSLLNGDAPRVCVSPVFGCLTSTSIRPREVTHAWSPSRPR